MARPRWLSPAQAAELLRPEDTLAVPLGPGQPAAFLHALGERGDWRELTVFSALLVDLFHVFTRPGVRLLSGFFGPVERGLAASGHRVEFVPEGFRGFAGLAERLQPRVVATAAAPPGRDGQASLSLHAGATVEALLAAGRDPERLLVVETSPHLPRTRGLPPEHPHALPPDLVDVWIESDRRPVEIEDPEPGDVERAIAAIVRDFVPDGATLQTGIGGIPSEIVEILATGDGGGYGIHSEMFTTGLMKLHEAGKVANRKGVFDGVSVCTFAAGTRRLYAWLDGNDAVCFLPVDVVNEPTTIARNRRMVSINGALSVDLRGQVAADSIGPRLHSGIGGHEDFVMAARGAPGGRSLVCLPSRAGSGETRTSRIVAGFPPGTPVTTPRHHVDVVVTEHGAAELRGRTVAERARALLAVAHPDHRDALADEAGRLGLLGPGGG